MTILGVLVVIMILRYTEKSSSVQENFCGQEATFDELVTVYKIPSLGKEKLTKNE